MLKVSVLFILDDMGKICEGFISQPHPTSLFIKGFGCHHHHHHQEQQHQRLSTSSSSSSSVKNHQKSSTIVPRLINLDENEVTYRAEGNANIVLSLPRMRKVLRIRKSLINVEPEYDNGE